jgi:hypothetical protein
MLVILASWEAEIRKITVQSQPRQIVLEIPISKIARAKTNKQKQLDWICGSSGRAFALQV